MTAVLLGLGVLACAKKPDAADATGALKIVQAVATAEGATALRLRYQGCSELTGCAQGCADTLTFCAQADSEEAQRGAMLGKCFADAKQAASPDAWFLGHFEKFLDTARPLLSAADQHLFDEARARSPR